VVAELLVLVEGVLGQVTAAALGIVAYPHGAVLHALDGHGCRRAAEERPSGNRIREEFSPER
jgi:hypothetical protein